MAIKFKYFDVSFLRFNPEMQYKTNSLHLWSHVNHCTRKEILLYIKLFITLPLVMLSPFTIIA